MTSKREYHLIARFIVDQSCVDLVREHCSASGRFIRFPEVLCRVHTFRGVPGRLVDVLLPQQVYHLDWPLVCDVGRIRGSFDGAERFRLAFRPWPSNMLREPGKDPDPTFRHPSAGKIALEDHGEQLAVIALWERSGMWAHPFPVMRWEVQPGELPRILMHLWSAWYRFLPWEDASQLADYWASLPAVQQERDIVVLNRLAGEALYDLARQMGWRKLTLRDKARYGLAADGPQWQRMDGMILRRQDPSATGAGEFTGRAAAGDSEYIRTSYGSVSEE